MIAARGITHCRRCMTTLGDNEIGICDNCREELKKEQEENATAITTAIGIKIEEASRINKISELIFQQYRSIPPEKLGHLVKEFIENLKLLNDLYKK